MILENFLINANKFLKFPKKSLCIYVLERLDIFEDFLKFLGTIGKSSNFLWHCQKTVLIFSVFPEIHSKTFLIEQKTF